MDGQKDRQNDRQTFRPISDACNRRQLDRPTAARGTALEPLGVPHLGGGRVKAIPQGCRDATGFARSSASALAGQGPALAHVGHRRGISGRTDTDNDNTTENPAGQPAERQEITAQPNTTPNI